MIFPNSPFITMLLTHKLSTLARDNGEYRVKIRRILEFGTYNFSHNMRFQYNQKDVIIY
jgi:hypothetical protein